MVDGHDSREPLSRLIARLEARDPEILLIGAPAFYGRAKAREHVSPPDQLYPRFSTVGTVLMGDQDHEPYHAVCQLKGLLEAWGVRTSVLDLNAIGFLSNILPSHDAVDYLRGVLAHIRPRLVAVSVMGPNLSEGSRVASAVKSLLPETVVCMGGAASARLELDQSPFDHVFRGRDLVEAAKFLIASAGLEERVVDVSTSKWARQVRIPDYDDLPLEVPLVPRVFASTGCAAGCEFCAPAALLDYKVTVHAVDHVEDAIRQLRSRYQFDYFLLGDLTFHLRSRAGADLLHRLTKNSAGPWWCQTQARYLENFDCNALRDAGCVQLAFAVETVEAGIDTIDRKNAGVVAIKNGLERLKDAGIQTQTYWMFGLPGDTPSRCAARVALMQQLNDEGLVDAFHLSYLMPYQGTAYGDTPEKFGLLNVSSLDAHYELVSSDYYDPLPIYDLPEMTRYEIKDWLNRAKEVARSRNRQAES